MNNLTAGQIKTLNNISDVRDPALDLGTKLQSMIDSLVVSGTPVNAVGATKNLNFEVAQPVVHGELVTINNPLFPGSDVYEFTAHMNGEVTQPSYIPVCIESDTTPSTVNLTIDTIPTSGDGMILDGVEYIFVPVGTANAEGEISVGTSLALAQANIIAAINGTDGHNTPHPTLFIGEFSTNVATLRGIIGGTISDGISVSETFTAATNIFSAAATAGGADALTDNCLAFLSTSMGINDTQGISVVASAPNLVITAEVFGVSGNNIEISETLAHASFAGGATKLSGGVDGTLGNQGKLMINGTYLFVCVANNTVADRNWRRISLGSAY